METLPTLSLKTIKLFYDIEFVITMLFTVEYALRITCVKNKRDYILGFNGIIDFLAIFPFYLGLLVPSTHYFIVIRLLRLLRIFRIFNLLDYLSDGKYIIMALRSSARKIYIFLLFIAIFITLMGSIMYVVEGGEGSFNSIPNSIYWAAVTVTTVGYGDITPQTPIGKVLSVLVMVTGYSILAVTTIIVTLDFQKFNREQEKIRNAINIVPKPKTCRRCGTENEMDASYCKNCGKRLFPLKSSAHASGLFGWLFSGKDKEPE